MKGSKSDHTYSLHFETIPPSRFSKYYEECVAYYCNELVKYGEYRKQKNALKASRKSFDRYFKNSATWNRMFFYDLIVTERNLPIGYLWYQVESSSRECCLMYLIIDEAWRSKGFGREALAMYERDAYQRGIMTSFLYVFIHNPAVHLYLKNGYMIEKQVWFSSRQTKACTRYRMSKRLGPS